MTDPAVVKLYQSDPKIQARSVDGRFARLRVAAVLALLGLAVVAAFVAVQTTQGAAFWKLSKEARTEIRKVVWPTRQESTQTTLMVVAFVVVMALILWGLDTLLSWLASLIIG